MGGRCNLPQASKSYHYKGEDVIIIYIYIYINPLPQEDVEEKSACELNSELLVILLSQTNGKDLDTGFVRDWLASESSLLASTALLILGNLCTSDEATQALVTEDLLDQCTRLLQRDDQGCNHCTGKS